MLSIKKVILILLLVSTLFGNEKAYPVRVVKSKSPADIVTLFKELGYTQEAWKKGIREVPRVFLMNIPSRWSKESRKLPVKLKKELFFRLLAPAVLKANEEVLQERKVVEKALHSTKKLTVSEEKRLQQLAKKYKLVKEASLFKTDHKNLKALLERVDVVPVSLALAQSANESGWGTSRFALKGNSLFGQWDFSGKGMAPKQQRKVYGNYGLARFHTPQEAVNAYMLNLNTHRAYAKLRKKRAALRAEGKPITGMSLATTLDKYSERGAAYVKDIQQMISYNHLEAADSAYFSNKEIIQIVPVQ